MFSPIKAKARAYKSDRKITIGADNLRFLSFDGLVKSIGLKVSSLNTSCLTGVYPVSAPTLNTKKVRVERN